MSDLDDMLRRYLEREEQDPIRERLRGVTDWQTRHDEKDEQRHGEVVRALDGHNWRIQTLEQKAIKAEKAIEDTGNHHVVELTKKSDRVDAIVWDGLRLLLFLLIGGGIVEFIHRMAAK